MVTALQNDERCGSFLTLILLASPLPHHHRRNGYVSSFACRIALYVPAVGLARRACTLEQVSMAVLRRAKQAQLPGVSVHTLRHTFISRLVQVGCPLPEVAALAGHRAITMTLRYAHLAPSHLRAGIQALEDRQVGQPAEVTHRSACHAGVTGFWRERVSAGVPNGN